MIGRSYSQIDISSSCLLGFLSATDLFIYFWSPWVGDCSFLCSCVVLVSLGLCKCHATIFDPRLQTARWGKLPCIICSQLLQKYSSHQSLFLFFLQFTRIVRRLIFGESSCRVFSYYYQKLKEHFIKTCFTDLENSISNIRK